MPSHYVIFSHGKESGPWGTKIKTLAETANRLGYEVSSVDYQGIEDVNQRIEKLVNAIPDNYEQLILVGSSMGAYVAIEASQQVPVQGLFLLAPAVYIGYPNDNPVPKASRSTVIHGWQDDIVPVENAIRFANTHQTSCHLMADGHRLMTCLPQINAFFRLFLLENKQECK